MHIRRLVPSDAAQYQQLRLQGLRESPAAFSSSYEEEREMSLEDIAGFLAPDSGRILFGAFVGEELAGMVGVGRERGRKEQHKAFVRSMYVKPAYRAKGCGRLLLAQASAFAEAMPGVLQITLAVTAGNVPAIRLYRGAGFEAYGVAPAALLVGGVFYDEIQMVRHRGEPE